MTTSLLRAILGISTTCRTDGQTKGRTPGRVCGERGIIISLKWEFTGISELFVACSYGALDVRRKNATRESTSTLKAWLYEHIKNPYPTKGEKIMLAIITKMTLTQVVETF